MSAPVSANTQYFLGVNGEQTGPFTESQILERVRANLIPSDTLIWFEGLSDWQPINSFSPFKEALKVERKVASAPPPPATAVFKSLNGDPIPSQTVNVSVSTGTSNPSANSQSFSAGKNLDPVFSEEEAVFKGSSSKSYLKVIAGVLIMGLAGGLTFFLIDGQGEKGAAKTEAISNAKKLKATTSREDEIRKALSELVLNPKASLEILTKNIKENSTDEIGSQALSTVIDYYRVHNPHEAGELYFSLNRFEAAIPFFMTPPINAAKAEQASFKAFEVSTDPEKRKQLLSQDIQLLLGPLKQKNVAIERIKLFQTTFPSETNVFSYYLKSPEAQIKDLFNRISFYYVQSLLSHLQSEMPEIRLPKKPVIEVRKDKTGKYRIVGTYRGDVKLNRDLLNDIYFEFWLNKEVWVLTDTNLTIERKKLADKEKETLRPLTSSQEELLQNLENTFQTQFPQNSLHETLPVKKDQN
jgi:hypothetical protein